MNNKKSTIYILIITVLVLIIGSVSYKFLSKNYKDKSNEKSLIQSEERENNVPSAVKEPKKDAKDFQVYRNNGEVVKLSDFKDKKAVVVNFWASWCPPCKFEMPFFNKAIEKYDSNKVEIIMVNLTDGQRETKDKAKKYILDNGYNMSILFDEDFSAADTYKLMSIPRTLFISKDGKIINDHIGIIDEDFLNETIEGLIQE